MTLLFDKIDNGVIPWVKRYILFCQYFRDIWSYIFITYPYSRLDTISSNNFGKHCKTEIGLQVVKIGLKFVGMGL